MQKIGIIGAGDLGKTHIKYIREIPNLHLIGFYDMDQHHAKKVAKELEVKSFEHLEDLIDQTDVVDIATPTIAHYECAVKAIKKSKHVFIEKPVTYTINEAKSLMELALEANVKVQVGNYERFNPAFRATLPYFSQPMFIEAQRLTQFNPADSDVSVVMDLMIHDIDIILSVVKSPIKRISANGVAILNDTPDIASARIEFDNGCVANLTASRISLNTIRKARFYQRNSYITLDYYEKEANVIRLKEPDQAIDPSALIIDLEEAYGTKQIFIESPKIESVSSIQEELNSFCLSVTRNTPPEVSIEDGYHALCVANKILEKLKLSTNLVEAE
jgi:predicted dehydrogenase